MVNHIRGWINSILFIVCTLWIVLVYLGFHPEHLELLPEHPYVGLIVGVGLLAGGVGWWSGSQIKRKKKWGLNVRGSVLIGLALLMSLIVLFAFRVENNLTRPTGGTAAVFFIFNSCYYLLLLLFLSVGLFGIGRGSKQLLGILSKHALVDIALGTLILALISTLLGLVGLLYGPILWVLLVGSIFWQRQAVITLLKDWFIIGHQWRIYHWWQLPIALLGLFFVGIYWLGGIKAFPTGFDGAALYANMATLIGDYHQLPGAYQPYSWSLVMSWGQLLFGSLTMSLLLSHMVFLPALCVAYLIIRRWLKASYALIAVVMVLSIPMLGFQAMIDEKVDLGLLFISLAVIEELLSFSFESFKESKWQFSNLWTAAPSRILFVLGLFLGFCFTIKYTAVFLLVGCIAYLLWRIGGAALFWGWLGLFTGVIFLSGFYRMGNLPLIGQEAQWIGGGFGVAGSALMVFQYLRNRKQWVRSWKTVLLIGIGFLLAFAPWAGKHIAENNYQFSISNILYGQPDRVNLTISRQYLSGHFNQAPSEVGEPRSFRRLTQNSKPEPKKEESAKLAGNATREELQRYLGYEEGVWRYLSAPFDLSFGVNVPGLRHQDIGFIFLLFFPFLFLATSRQSWLRNTGILLVFLFMLLAFYWTLGEKVETTEQLAAISTKLDSYWAARSQTTASGFPAFWAQLQQPFIALSTVFSPVFKAVANIPALLFIPILLLINWPLALLLRHRFKSWNKDLRGIAVFLFSYTIFWFLLGNTISWYAMLLWIFLIAIIAYYLQEASDYLPVMSKSVAEVLLGSVIGLQLLLNLVIALSSSQPIQPNKQIYNWPMVEYATTADLDQEKTLGLFDPVSPQVVDILNRDENALIYRINTYLQFHIDKNDQRVVEDNQLQRFADILNTVKQPDYFLDILKDNQVRYILYDINSPSLDRTPEKSLQQKCITLLNLLIRSPKAELILTDNYVEAPGSQTVRLPNGQQAAARPGLAGNVVYKGRVALFRIN